MRTLAHVSDLPLIIYDVPGRVGVAIADETVATLCQRGLAVGIKDATADLTPSLCGWLHHAWDTHDLASFATLRDLLAPLHDALFAESNPIPLKTALAILGLAEAEVRLPLLRAAQPTTDRLADLLPPIMDHEDWIASHPRYALAS